MRQISHQSAAQPPQPGLSPQPAFDVCSLQISVFLLGVAADSPARQKLAAWPGVMAYLACGWCVYQGQLLPGSTAMRFAGYAQPAPQTLHGHPDLLIGDAHVQLSDGAQRQRAELVEEFKRDGPQHGVSPKLAGCNGRSVLVHDLDYVSYSDVFILPIFHAGGPSASLLQLEGLWPHVGAQMLEGLPRHA